MPETGDKECKLGEKKVSELVFMIAKSTYDLQSLQCYKCQLTVKSLNTRKESESQVTNFNLLAMLHLQMLHPFKIRERTITKLTAMGYIQSFDLTE